MSRPGKSGIGLAILPLMTQARRPRLVPKTAIIAGVVIVVLVVTAVVAAVMVTRSRLVAVPDVAGLSAEDAKHAITEAGLTYELGGTRVSTSVSSGRVIEQKPAAKILVDPKTAVSVVLSVGPQTFVVPDLIGVAVESARETLLSLGLKVVTESVSVETTSPAVLEMFPAPGSSVSAGDEIRLVVPGGAEKNDVLLPYDLQGLTVLLDPMPAPGLQPDVPMEVARRLEALLEAAGATVTTTRSAAEPLPSPEVRQQLALTSSARLLIGIDLGSSGTPGMRVYHLPPGDGERSADSIGYAQSITRAANLPGLSVNEPQVSSDAVLSAFRHAGVRVSLADSTVEADRARFADPTWADQMARAIYRGVGTRFDQE